MSQNIDMELLRKVIAQSGIDMPVEETAQLIHDLLLEELNVQHLMRPHKILTKITQASRCTHWRVIHMFYKELRITNFKRFAGTNIFPLKGDGNVTIIAAKNGVGKTTVLDAFNLHYTEHRNKKTV